MAICAPKFGPQASASSNIAGPSGIGWRETRDQNHPGCTTTPANTPDNQAQHADDLQQRRNQAGQDRCNQGRETRLLIYRQLLVEFHRVAPA
jgi:hypothetical protein